MYLSKEKSKKCWKTNTRVQTTKGIKQGPPKSTEMETLTFFYFVFFLSLSLHLFSASEALYSLIFILLILTSSRLHCPNYYVYFNILLYYLFLVIKLKCNRNMYANQTDWHRSIKWVRIIWNRMWEKPQIT